MLEKLGEEIETFMPSSIDDVARLALKVDKALDPLCDEVLVLKHFPEWPQHKLDTIRHLAGRLGEVRQMQSMLDVKRFRVLKRPRVLKRLLLSLPLAPLPAICACVRVRVRVCVLSVHTILHTHTYKHGVSAWREPKTETKGKTKTQT
jgi:hypothetical protein